MDSEEGKKKTRIRKHFSSDEDMKLKKLVGGYGTKEVDWDKISRIMNRTIRQCKDRFHNYLSGKFSFSAFTTDEYLKILKLHSIIGPKWVKIASFLPGRTDTDIKCAFNRIVM